MESGKLAECIDYKQKRALRTVCKKFNRWFDEPTINKLSIEKFAKFRSIISFLNRDLEEPLAYIDHVYNFHVPGATKWLKQYFEQNQEAKKIAQEKAWKTFVIDGRVHPHPQRLAFLKEIGIQAGRPQPILDWQSLLES